MGCGELKDYFSFWNCVDWVCILLGALVISIWFGCTVCMNTDAIQDLLDGMKLKVDVQELNADQLDALTTALRKLAYMYQAMHTVMAINTVSIVLKFFKAFTSNPRLKVVTDTFSAASVDLAHFGIIFATMFLPF